MPTVVDSFSLQVIPFWQQGLWRERLNQLPIAANGLPPRAVCSPMELAKGIIDKPTLIGKRVWVAPKVLFRRGDDSYWVPLWIPATIEDSTLCVNDNSPWIPPSQYDPLSTMLFEPPEPWEECTLTQSWLEMYALAVTQLDDLSDNHWERALRHQGFELLGEAWVVSEEELHSFVMPSFHHEDFSLALSHYADLTLSESSSSSLSPEAWVCGEFSDGITDEIALRAALSLKEGDVIAVNSPIGANKRGFVESLIASTLVKCALKKVLPELYLLTPNESLLKMRLAVQPNSQSSEDPHSTLLKTYSDFQALMQKEKNETVLAGLQSEDAKLEGQLITLIDLQESRRQRTIKEKIVNILFPKKSRDRELTLLRQTFKEALVFTADSLDLQLSQHIRRIKVRRAKIDQEKTIIVEKITLSQSLNKQHGGKALTVLRQAMCCLALETLRHNAPALEKSLPFWSKRWHLAKLMLTPSVHWVEVDAVSHADCLIVDEANCTSPQSVVPHLQHAQTALFLGDGTEKTSPPCLSAAEEGTILSRLKLSNSDVVDTMQERGLLMSTGSAFCAARQCHPAQLPVALDASKTQPTIHAIQVDSNSEFTPFGRINPIEAKQIVFFLKANRVSMGERFCIITPFIAQQREISRALREADLSCSVYDFESMPFEQFDAILFSPVYGSSDKRPFVFDQGEHWFSSMLSRTCSSLWIVGNIDIFDKRMHSPSGELAKQFSKYEEIVPIAGD